MHILNRPTVFSIAAVALLLQPLASAPPKVPLYQLFLSPASPQEVVAARKVDRIAWVDYAEGKRNAYAAAAPLFAPVRLTNFLKDDGIMMSGIRISDDGSTVVFLRGEAPNREGWSPNPIADPNGPEHAVWAARTSVAGGAWRVVDAANPEIAPDGSAILFVKGGQIYRAKLTPTKPASEVDRGEKAFITEWGVQSEPKWSPDGRKIAFVSTRTDHSFIAVYDIATRSLKYMSPSVDFDTTPMWLPDSKHLIFERRPGLPFGQQAQQGGGGIGFPNGPAAQTAAATAPGGRGGRGRQGGFAEAASNNVPGSQVPTTAGRAGSGAARGGQAGSAPAAAQQLSRPDASYLQRRLYAGVLQSRRHHWRRAADLAQPAQRCHCRQRRESAPHRRSGDFRVWGGRRTRRKRRTRRPEEEPLKRPPRRRAARHPSWTNGTVTTRSTLWIPLRVPCC